MIGSFLEQVGAELFAGDAGDAFDFNDAFGGDTAPLIDGAGCHSEFTGKAALSAALLLDEGLKISHAALLAVLSFTVKRIVSCAVCSFFADRAKCMDAEGENVL